MRYDVDLALTQLGRLPEAVALYDTVLAIAPTEPTAYRYLGAALEQSGRGPEARAAFARSLDVRPADGAAPYLELAQLWHGAAAAAAQAPSVQVRELATARKAEAVALQRRAAALFPGARAREQVTGNR